MTPIQSIPTEAVEAERYCLGLIAEEAGEVLQWVGKSLRFGHDTPGRRGVDGAVTGETSRDLMPIEVGDFQAAVEFAIAHGVLDGAAVASAKAKKLAKLLDPAALDNLGRPLAPQPLLDLTPAAGEGVAVKDAREATTLEWDGHPTPSEAVSILRRYAEKRNLPPRDNNFDDAASVIERLEAMVLLSALVPIPADTSASAVVRAYPDEATPELTSALGFMNFITVPIAHLFRAAGADIPPKAEAEQAYVLHWLTKLALDFPEDWRARAEAEIQKAKAALASSKREG